MVSRFRTLVPDRARSLRVASTIGLALTLLACSSGEQRDAITPAATMVSGAVTKGSTVGASISVFAFDFSGQPVGTALATTTSDANGNFQLSGLNPARAYLVRACGGAFKDESDKSGLRVVTLASNQCLESVLPAGATGVAVTPYTQALVDKIRREAVNNSFASLLNSARSIFADAIGFDVLLTLPTDPIAPSGSPQQIAYDMALGGAAATMNRLAIQSGLPGFTFEIILAFSRDLSDGRLDGQADGAAIEINGATLQDLDINTLIRLFRNNNFYAGYQDAMLVEINEDLLSRRATAEANDQPPVAVDDVYAGTPGQVLEVPAPGVLANDRDPNGLEIRARLISGPTSGELEFQPEGGFRFTPPAEADEISAQFTYVVRNEREVESEPATVTINLTRRPRIRIADAQIVEGNSGTTELSLPVRLSFATSEIVRVSFTTMDGSATAGSDYTPVSGTLLFPADTLQADIPLEILGDSDIEADERFQLQLSDPQNALIDQGVAVITILNDDFDPGPSPEPTPVPSPDPTPTPVPTSPPTPPPNQNPVANNDSLTVNEDAGITTVNVLANDSDPDGGTLSIIGVAPGSQGATTSIFSNQIRYQSAPNFNGSETFSYTISDGQGGSASAIVNVTVNPVNDPPAVAVSGPKTVSIDSPPAPITTFDINATDVDNPPLNTLIFGLTTPPSCGRFTLSGSPATGFTQQDIVNNLVAFDAFNCIGGDLVNIGMELTDGFAVVPFTFTVQVSASCTAPPSGMVAWITGDTAHTPSPQTMPPTTYDIQFARRAELVNGASAGVSAGKAAEGLQFDGVDDVVSIPDDEAWNFGSQDFTIDLWAKFASDHNPAFVANDEAPGQFNKWIFYRQGGLLQFHFNTPADPPVDIGSTAFNPVIGQWHHLAVSRASGRYTFYVDGVPVEVVTNATPIPNAAAPLTIGAAEGTFHFNGSLDEVEIFKRALSDAEINAIYRSGVSGKCKPAATSDDDGDGMQFLPELTIGTNPNNPDTDGDGLLDGQETNYLMNGTAQTFDPGDDTDPLNPDTDGDGAKDGLEVQNGTDPLIADGALYVSPFGSGSDGLSWANAFKRNSDVQISTPYTEGTGALYIFYDNNFSNGDGLLLDVANTARNPIILVGSLESGLFPPIGKAGASAINTVFNAAGDFRTTDPAACGGEPGNDAALIIRGVGQVNIQDIGFRLGRNDCSDGGGISIIDSNVRLTNVWVTESRSANSGGGIGIKCALTPCNIVIEKATISENRAGSLGGGIHSDAVNSFSLLNSIIASNTTDGGDGSGVASGAAASTVQIRNNQFLSNHNRFNYNASLGADQRAGSGSGGAIHVNLGSTATAKIDISNNLLSGNDAGLAGGGIFATAGTVDDLRIANNTIAFNRAENPLAGDDGGGIKLAGSITTGSGTVRVVNNILWYNQNENPTPGQADDNFADPSATATRVQNNIQGLAGGSDIGADPGDKPLFVQDFYLDQLDSPSVNAGDGLSAGGLDLNLRTTDASGSIFDSGLDDQGYHHDTGGLGPATGLNLLDACGDPLPTSALGCYDVLQFQARPLFGGAIQPGHRVAAYVYSFESTPSPDGMFAGTPGNCTGVPDPDCPEIVTEPAIFTLDSDPLGRLLRDTGLGTYRLKLKSKSASGDVVIHFLIDGDGVSEGTMIEQTVSVYYSSFSCGYAYGSPYYSQRPYSDPVTYCNGSAYY